MVRVSEKEERGDETHGSEVVGGDGGGGPAAAFTVGLCFQQGRDQGRGRGLRLQGQQGRTCGEATPAWQGCHELGWGGAGSVRAEEEKGGREACPARRSPTREKSRESAVVVTPCRPRSPLSHDAHSLSCQGAQDAAPPGRKVGEHLLGQAHGHRLGERKRVGAAVRRKRNDRRQKAEKKREASPLYSLAFVHTGALHAGDAGQAHARPHSLSLSLSL
jgi:hypothetical protein